MIATKPKTKNPAPKKAKPPAQPKEAGWDLPPIHDHGAMDMWELARTFEELDRDELNINSTDGFRRTRQETLGKKPKKFDPAIDPPAGINTVWTTSSIQTALNEHYLGTFSNSAYLVEAMIGDARVAFSLASRIKGFTKRKPYFEPNPRAKNKKLAKYICDQYQEMYYDILPLDIQEQLWLWTPMMGFALFNMVWGPGLEDMYLPTLRHWHPAYTFYLMSGNLEDRKLQAITMGGGGSQTMTTGIDIGDPEWFHFAPFGAYRGWIRGAVRQTAIPWIVRNFSLRDWSRLGEVHGLPQRIVKVPANSLEEDKARIFNKLIRLASEATFVLPVAADGTGFAVELLEPKNTESYKVLEQLGHRCDSDITLAIKGTQLMGALGDQKGGSSSHAAAKSVEQEDSDFSESDAIKFASAVRHQILTPITRYNYEDAEDCVPLLTIADEPPDDKVKNSTVYMNLSQALLNFKQLGAELDIDQIGEAFDIPFLSNKLEPTEPAEAPTEAPTEQAQMFRKTKGKV
jgi:hypothetical protein